jgi:hypothetical protein
MPRVHAASTPRLALVAIAFHAPGLRLFARYRVNRSTLIANLVAVGITLAAMVWAGWRYRTPASVVVAWLIGHVVWSACLAALVITGRAGAVVAR